MQERYRRNLGALSEEECRLLGEKRVLLAGCGGLGGYLLEYLVRLGVGHVTAVADFLTPENARSLLAGHHLALDALDSGADRRTLEAACGALGLPLVHGAIQGWYLQVGVVPPGSGLLSGLYPPGRENSRDKSTLSFVPALCAALQAAEAVKLLCGRESTLWGRLLYGDALSQEYQLLPLSSGSES